VGRAFLPPPHLPLTGEACFFQPLLTGRGVGRAFLPPTNLPLAGEAYFFSPSCKGGVRGGLFCPHLTSPSQGRLTSLAPPAREGCGEGFPAPTNLPLTGEAYFFSPSCKGGVWGGLSCSHLTSPSQGRLSSLAPHAREGCGEGFPAPTNLPLPGEASFFSPS